jgi:hypothetical protein
MKSPDYPALPALFPVTALTIPVANTNDHAITRDSVEASTGPQRNNRSGLPVRDLSARPMTGLAGK